MNQLVPSGTRHLESRGEGQMDIFLVVDVEVQMFCKLTSLWLVVELGGDKQGSFVEYAAQFYRIDDRDARLLVDLCASLWMN